MKRIFCAVFAGAVLFSAGAAFAGDKGDLQIWETIDIPVKLNEQWSVNFQEEFRNEGQTGLYYHHTDVGLVYKGIADWIDLGLNFRKVYKEDSSGTWRQENRPHINVTFKKKIFGLAMSDRNRFEYRDVEKSDDLWRYRNMLKAAFPLEVFGQKIGGYVADEVFVDMSKKGFSANRLYAGIDFKLAENVGSSIYYIWQTSRSTGEWDDIQVVGAKLKYAF